MPSKRFPDVFESCAVTRAMSKIKSDEYFSNVEVPPKVLVPGWSVLPSSVSQGEWIAAQQSDPELKGLFDAVLTPNEIACATSGYFVQDKVLLRKWSLQGEQGIGEPLVQVVVPVQFREVVLKMAHGDSAGHLGVRKTYNRVLQHFYWPKLKKDIAHYVKTCHTCQMTGKPNQILKPAPLYPIPVAAQPFQHLIIDCVGLLPWSKVGNEYLLTVMCQVTRYPAVYPLRRISTKAVVKALSQFISIFGIPKIVQSDCGSNFTSKMFSDTLKCLGIQQNLSSAYHPQSQGALERFHQTLKALFRAYCVELKRDW